MNLLILYAQTYSFSLFLQTLIFRIFVYTVFCKKEEKNKLTTFLFIYLLVVIIFLTYAIADGLWQKPTHLVLAQSSASYRNFWSSSAVRHDSPSCTSSDSLPRLQILPKTAFGGFYTVPHLMFHKALVIWMHHAAGAVCSTVPHLDAKGQCREMQNSALVLHRQHWPGPAVSLQDRSWRVYLFGIYSLYLSVPKLWSRTMQGIKTREVQNLLK